MRSVILLLIALAFVPISYADEGLTVTSVSTSDVITKTTEPSSVYWIINANLNGGGQSITGTVSPDEVKSEMNGKVYSKQPLSITVSSTNEQVFYEVINEGQPIYKYTTVLLDAPQSYILGILTITGDPPLCPSAPNWDLPLGQSFWNHAKKRYCIYKQQVGVKGVYNNPTIGFNARIKLSAGNTVKEKTICSGAISGCDGSSVSFDELGVATWTGSLVTGESAPNQDNYVAILGNNKWQIARKSTYDNYLPQPSITDNSLNSFKNLFPGYSDVTRGDIEIKNAITPANHAADLLLNEDTSFSSSPFSKDDNTGKVVVTLSRRLTSPNVVFRIRADWIGIVIPVGQPIISDVSSNKIQSGESGSINVQVKNVGEAAGTFSATLMDCGPFIPSSSSATSRKTIQPGDVDVIPIAISGGAEAEDIIKTCTIKVYDVNDPSIETTGSVTLQLEKPKVCFPDKVFADGDVIKKCNKEGSAIDLVVSCKNGVSDDGKGGFFCTPTEEEKKKYECVQDSDCGDTAFCNQKIHFCIQKSGCINILKNGDSDKHIDVAFVGDGYNNNDELKKDVLIIIDYEGKANGMMSVEPFNSNKDKFNFWIIKADDSIPFDNNFKGPNRGKSLEIAAECTISDYSVVLSKKRFRSYAFFSGDAYLSLGSYPSSRWGRLMLHEFGHSFGQLADEYVEPQIGNWPRPPNCAPDRETAQKWWGSVSNTGLYQGCSYMDGNIRPTFNSIMRNHHNLKDDYGKVNEIGLLKVMNKYG